MDWLFFVLDSFIFIIIVAALMILAFAAGLMLVRFLGGTKPLLIYGVPLTTSLVAFILGSRIAYYFLFDSFPSARWLNWFIVVLLFPLSAPFILEALRYSRRELRR